MVFCALISIGIGHGLYVLLRRDFHLRRQVEQQRASLSKLADHLESRVAEQMRSLQNMHHRAQHIRAEQRVELARDLHDGLGQELTSLRAVLAHASRLGEGWILLRSLRSRRSQNLKRAHRGLGVVP